MGFMAALTVAALLVIAGFVKEISRTPTVARPAALTATARHASSSASSHRKPSPAASVQVPTIADTSSGLSYQLLASPWQRGCPSILNTATLTWSAGEHAVAGQVDLGGSVFDWHGNACSGQLQQQFAYSGPADLESVTMHVTDVVESSYYGGLVDQSSIQGSAAIQVSGHQAWLVTFVMTYPDAASEGLAWTSEAGAVVVVDRGAGQAPAVFYTSVPNDLGNSAVSTLVSSLRLSPG
jgi:hypothetical protein